MGLGWWVAGKGLCFVVDWLTLEGRGLRKGCSVYKREKQCSFIYGKEFLCHLG